MLSPVLYIPRNDGWVYMQQLLYLPYGPPSDIDNDSQRDLGWKRFGLPALHFQDYPSWETLRLEE